MAATPTTTASKSYQPTTTTKYQPTTSEDVSKYTRKKTCAEVFFLFNKVSGLQSAALSKKRLRRRCFLVKLPRAHFFIEYLRTTASERTQDFTNNGPSSNSY